ncbi:endoglucanase [Vibrio inusitatus NBRC 102082]|uniref:Endoglucanase n=1 Tax=Vibrio inusitatus NBRC 102082 TaxID=1219070 RepID=A0A4Y3HT18_9VIBR|nr:glycoside hydrolase family 9 protein [Vibrio inusitatus]GEA49892.1 endoglucanase [Vibrio inusitatus NBRC 102082]
MKEKFACLAMAVLSTTALANNQMVRNGSFENELNGWWSSGNRAVVEDGEACIDINESTSNPWDIVFGQGGFGLEQGERYQIEFTVRADQNTRIRAVLQHDGAPYTTYVGEDVRVSKSARRNKVRLTQKHTSDDNVTLQFQMGGQKQTKVCISDVSILGKQYVKKEFIQPVRVNQTGYLPNANKIAVIQTHESKPIAWKVKDATGQVLASGKTTVFGDNKASNEHVHQVDFSNLKEEDTNLVLSVDGKDSFPFAISSDIYEQLTEDAFLYFYHNRSAIDVLEQYVQRQDLARPAGHASDVVTCFDKRDKEGNMWPGCDFEIDVSGGWYDAGDHGKYVVNGGISTWTLLNLYERFKHIESIGLPLERKNNLIPESESGVNNVLSEARWNLEFMLAMQIPEGKKVYAPVGDQSAEIDNLQLTEIDAGGLAFHKVADERWAKMPYPPHLSDIKRYVGQPSTAATLNLSAVAAQGARIWRDIDEEFADRCLQSAERAWNAALNHPEIYAYNNFNGSGPYGDLKISDELYWAAAELYITTGEDKYKQFVESSNHFLETPVGDKDSSGDFYWREMAPAGTISLAVVPNNLGEDKIQAARDNLIKTARAYNDQAKSEGYNLTYNPENYPWGSNSNVVNRSIFLIYGYDFSGSVDLLKSAASNMDYVLGTNPLNLSYVTGYGSKFVHNPHHRFWAHQNDNNSPRPAPGALSGGPNSISFSDPIASAMSQYCHPQTCFKDDIGAWTLNEITINWNSPLVWVSSSLNHSELK